MEDSGRQALDSRLIVNKGSSARTDTSEDGILNNVMLGYYYLLLWVIRHWLPLPAAVAGSVLAQKNYVWAMEALVVSDVLIWWCIACCVLTVTMLMVYFRSGRDIYLLEASCYRPPNEWRIPFRHFVEHAILSGRFTPASVEFQRKIMERAAVSESVAVPPALHYLPPKINLDASLLEAEVVMFSCVEDLLQKTNVHPHDIAVLVVNCSVFNPVPSLSSMIVNKFEMRSDIKTFNLGGMGCSANIIALQLASDCLVAASRGGYAIAVSTENVTQNWYFGNHDNMLVSNCIFRMGCGAVLLSSRRGDRHRAKYRLLHLVRTHRAADDLAYRAAFQEEDPNGNVGVALSKQIMEIAADALKTNMRQLGPLVLPYRVQLLFLFNIVYRKVAIWNVIPYVPNFTRVFDHICIHSGGKAVIRAVQKGLKLPEKVVEPSKMALYRFGNTSSATTWYQFQYLESKRRMFRGQKIWQICLGSGFKCNGAVWIVNRDIPPQTDNAWSDSIIHYPAQIPNLVNI